MRSKPPLRNRIKPAQELEVQQIMDNFNCKYDDVVEAIDLYNLDIEECMQQHDYRTDMNRIIILFQMSLPKKSA